MLILMGCGIASMFVPVRCGPGMHTAPTARCPLTLWHRVHRSSAWYPLLHNIYLYGGLGLFTLYIAYDTQKMIDEFEMGVDDHIKHATDLFLDFKIVFTRVMQVSRVMREAFTPSLSLSHSHSLSLTRGALCPRRRVSCST